MSLHTVANLKDSISGILSGITLSNVDDLNPTLERAVATLVQKADIPEASGIQNITLYSGVFDYECDERIFGTAITDIRPQGITRNPSDFVVKTDQETFDRTKDMYYPSGTMSTFQYENGVPIIRIAAPFPKQQVIIDPMSAIGDSPNQWVAAGSASNLAVDSTVFYATPASLRFTLTGSSVGTITKTLISSLDMSDYEGVGVAFLAIFIPTGATADDLTGISLRLGSDSSNYSFVTATQGFLGNWVAGQWLLVAFDFASATDTLSPDWSAIDYVQVRLTHSSTFTNFRLGGLWMSFPTPAQILYQSSAVFLAVDSTSPTTTITDNDDTIILTDAAYNIYLQEAALAVLQNVGSSAADATRIAINQKLDGSGNDVGLYALFRGDNPSQELRTIGSYYDNSPGYNSRC